MDTCCALCIVSFLSKDIEVNNENMEDNSWLHSQTCQALLEQTPTSYIELRALHYAPAMVVSYLPGLLKFIPQSMRQVCFMCSLGCLYYKKLLQLYPALSTRDKFCEALPLVSLS